MANTSPLYRKPVDDNDVLTTIADTTGTPDNTYTFVLGTVTVTAATGGAIAALAMGLSSIKGTVLGRSVTSSHSGDTVTTGSATGSQCFIAWGPSSKKRVNS